MTRFCMLRVQDSKSELGNLTPAAASPNLQFTPFPFRHHSKSVFSRLIWDSWESLRIASGDQKDRSKCYRSHFGRYFRQGGIFTHTNVIQLVMVCLRQQQNIGSC